MAARFVQGQEADRLHLAPLRQGHAFPQTVQLPAPVVPRGQSRGEGRHVAAGPLMHYHVGRGLNSASLAHHNDVGLAAPAALVKELHHRGVGEPQSLSKRLHRLLSPTPPVVEAFGRIPNSLNAVKCFACNLCTEKKMKRLNTLNKGAYSFYSINIEKQKYPSLSLLDRTNEG
jgi:hypothetical protein